MPAGSNRPVSKFPSAICVRSETVPDLQPAPAGRTAKLAIAYDKIYPARQTVQWEGEEITLTRLAMNSRQPGRATGKSLEAKAERQLADVQPINELWGKFMDVRARLPKCRQAFLP